MSVKVHHPNVPGSIAPNGKPVSNQSTSQRNKIFEYLLNAINVKKDDGVQDGETAAVLQHRRPPSSMITNQGDHRAAANIAQPPAPMQNTSIMAASALISLATLTSGPNRLSSFCTMGSGTAGRAGAAMALLNASTAGSSSAEQTRGIGNLCARFESGDTGPDTIGFDPKGGTSYGTFQISSRAGTMDRFLDYLSEKAPGLANRLKAAGPANTGSRHGKMPAVWQKIAAEDPERFSKLQYDFIEQTHYLPALHEIQERTGVDLGRSPKAVQEVLWSTAVQHGPLGAAKIFSRAVARSRKKSGDLAASKLIGSVYGMRAGQFGSSPADIRAAVRNRFKQEGKLALAMLAEPSSPDGVRA